MLFSVKNVRKSKKWSSSKSPRFLVLREMTEKRKSLKSPGKWFVFFPRKIQTQVIFESTSQVDEIVVQVLMDKLIVLLNLLNFLSIQDNVIFESFKCSNSL